MGIKYQIRAHIISCQLQQLRKTQILRCCGFHLYQNSLCVKALTSLFSGRKKSDQMDVSFSSLLYQVFPGRQGGADNIVSSFSPCFQPTSLFWKCTFPKHVLHMSSSFSCPIISYCVWLICEKCNTNLGWPLRSLDVYSYNANGFIICPRKTPPQIKPIIKAFSQG